MNQKNESKMNSKDVIFFYTQLENLGINIWIDGGWAVDALVGKQTRFHQDLDIAVERKNLLRAKEYFESLGFYEIERDKDKKWDLVLEDEGGREIEIHTFLFDKQGDVVPEPYWDGYDAESLIGEGIIDGHIVRCVSLDQLIKTHNSNKRKLKDTDYQDIQALEGKFNIKFNS